VHGYMPSQFLLSSPCPFERNKGVGCGSLYCGLACLIKTNVESIKKGSFLWLEIFMWRPKQIMTKEILIG